MALALIALGSNLQQPQVQVSHAIQVLAQTPGLTLLKASSLYATAPVGYDNQPDFINAVTKNTKPVSDYNLGLDVVKILEGAQQSIKQKGKEVVL